jgi:acetone carboxylase beta subunit
MAAMEGTVRDARRTPKVLAIDAGGTMCDTFVIDEQGEFVVGKSQTTPDDESRGFVHSASDALHYWDMRVEDAFPTLVSGVYSGTAMLNRLLSRQGGKIGLLVSAGQEDYLLLERGIQTYLGYSYSDRLHVQTHVHNVPLVPRERVHGIPGRIDLFGNVAIPLYEEETRKAVDALLDEGVGAICICLLHSYQNPAHEQEVKRIAREAIAARDLDVPLFLSSELYPVRGDFARLNTLMIEAYAAEPSRGHMAKIESRCNEYGAPFDLRVMASHGGTISTKARELARTLVSGPIGGVVGGRHLGRLLGIDNLVCTDIGGTSFDLALITEGTYQIRPNPEIARFVLALPQVQVDSIGAGTGSFVRVNPTNNRIELGPDSAGARIGMCYPEGGVDTPSVTDCHVVLGYLDPNYVLGAEIKLSRELAVEAVETRIARPLGLDVYRAAEGVIEILEDSLRNQVYSTIVGRGYSPRSFVCMSYGGGGPVHVAGYTDGMGFDDVLIPTWAAGFSAYGCSCADFAYRYDQSVAVPLVAGMSDEQEQGVVALLNAQADALKEKVRAEFRANGIAEDTIDYELLMRLQYAGQLNDLEVGTGKPRLESFADVARVLEDFEDLYGKVYSLSARSPELGYLITTLVVAGRSDVEKPILPSREPAGEIPPARARKGEREVYWRGEFRTAEIWNMDALMAGNVVRGLAIIEAPSTTLLVPPGRVVELDGHMIFHMREDRSRARAR